ncbi:hypothetical protein TanjilG_24545 [Lupinus angustifolius]|uniref:Uncharacterized protein n=1 Tax=Lupinus angustifolius TaxID=3871 RepID=A0A394D8C0_LUPAN|nr:hypothetical protein TanjilG_24545 [Lupinus angustifolius]
MGHVTFFLSSIFSLEMKQRKIDILHQNKILKLVEMNLVMTYIDMFFDTVENKKGLQQIL